MKCSRLFVTKNLPGKVLLLLPSHTLFPCACGMSEVHFEQVAKKVFPELDDDLVPYIASILEENQTASAEELEETLSPILTGYEVVSEEEIAKRCKLLPSKLHRRKAKQE